MAPSPGRRRRTHCRVGGQVGKGVSPHPIQRKAFFPLMGYSLRDVGGKSGDGYKPAGYRFLDGTDIGVILHRTSL